MNILLLNWRDVTHPRAGGAEMVTMEHAKGWIKAGHKVTWLTGWYGGLKEETIEGVHIVRRAGSLTIYLYAVMYLLINGRHFDVIVDEAHGFPFYSPLLTKKPVVLFIHEIAGEIWDYMFKFPKNVIGKLLESSYFRLYKRGYVWTDAPSTVDELVERGIPRNHCIAIPCPIVNRNPLKVKFIKEANQTYIFVSRVVRMKGIEEIIKSFSFIYREDPMAQFWIVGGGEQSYFDELKEMVKDYGIERNVTFFGMVSEKMKYELMQRSHILLHASVKEGWGLVVLEAASVGTPSVVYNTTGLKDVVQDRKTGIVIFDNSPHSMASQALTLMNDRERYARYQKNGKEWAESLQWDDCVKVSEKLLLKAVQKASE